MASADTEHVWSTTRPPDRAIGRATVSQTVCLTVAGKAVRWPEDW